MTAVMRLRTGAQSDGYYVVSIPDPIRASRPPLLTQRTRASPRRAAVVV